MTQKEIEIIKNCTIKAIEYFDKNPWDAVNNSRTGDLVYNGKPYPAKLILISINNQIDTENLDVNFKTPKVGEETFQFFESLGFEIKRKKLMNITKLQKYWEDYKKYFELPKSEHQEKYKWGVLKQVYDKWNWSSEDVAEMFNNAFLVEGKKNLWESGNFYPIKHTLWMFQHFKNETINEFNNLFNEQIELKERIKSFINFYNLKLPELQKIAPDKKINYHSHNDLRAIALYLTLQYPEKYFLFKFTMFKNFSLKLELPSIKGGDNNNLLNFIDLSNNVLEFIKKDSDFINSYKEFTSEPDNFKDESLHLLTQDFIYTIANHFNNGVRYWKIGSYNGEKSYFNEMINQNFIGVGWNEIGDLEEQEIIDRKGVQELLVDEGFEFKTTNVLSRKAGEIYDFYSNASMDDIVVLMDGNSVLAIGKIITDYNYDDTKPFSHYREVEWLKKDIKNFNLTDGVQTTFYQLTKKETIDRILKELKNNSSTNQSKEMSTPNKKHSLNQILYGAPGTGKTYNTKKLAVEIIEGKEYTDRDAILDKYDELVKTNQIQFTTFHQSMSYEDFIEGIKPETIDNKVTYEVKDGIFKQIADFANSKSESNFEEAYNNLIKEILEKGNDYLVLNTPKNKTFRVNVNSNNNLNLYTSENINKQGTLTKEKLFKQVNGFQEFNGWEGYVTSVIQYLKENHNLKISDTTSEKNYVLIIDEINRGNVSTIFGELITLLEEDKRKGSKEEIEVVLPYSQDKFSVPNNLYIIGTMNTADRSVESLDTALRRRFSFVEMPSNPKLLENKKLDDSEIDMAQMLEVINKRIELLIDKDHQIGHSFFINLTNFEELKFVFKNKILPLLEEYFFGDFGKIGLVLGENFISVKNDNKGVLAKFSAYDDTDFLTEKKVYQIKNCDELETADFISIYE
ncbi:McrB family protein [Flavobacterium davisii]|uniref:McrB family protein n=1 Tax=Flavobacterium davisii TaxID=2906077 RepID=UPI0035CF7AE6